MFSISTKYGQLNIEASLEVDYEEDWDWHGNTKSVDCYYESVNYIESVEWEYFSEIKDVHVCMDLTQKSISKLEDNDNVMEALLEQANKEGVDMDNT